MSDVSPDSSVSNISVQVTMPEFPFFGKLDPASITPQLAEVLNNYYKACVAVAAVGVGVCPVSPASVSGASSCSRRRRRRRGSRTRVRSLSSGVERVAGVVPGSVVGDSVRLDSRAGDGACYLALLHEARRRDAWEKCGAWPTFDEVMRLPVDWFDVAAVEVHNLSRVDAMRFHLTTGPGPSVKRTLAGLARSRSDCVEGVYPVARVWPADEKLQKYLPDLGARLGGTEVDKVGWLSEMSGLSVDLLTGEDLAIVTSSAANLPVLQKQRLKLFEASGDCVLSMAVATRCLDKHLTAQAYQEARSVVTSNATLASVFVSRVPPGFVVFPAGVDPGRGKAGANVLEALFGYVYSKAGMSAVLFMCERLRMFDEYLGWQA